MSWQIPLAIVASVFLLVVLWQNRPAFVGTRPSLRVALKDARARIEGAKDEPSRALALCDAGDACALALGRANTAIGYYLRAMRCDPHSVAIVDRAALGLAKRPRALESLMWRRLGAEAWTDGTREPAMAALRQLVKLYEGRLRDPHRARAIEHALAALSATAGYTESR
jgi:hypothetical protein